MRRNLTELRLLLQHAQGEPCVDAIAVAASASPGRPSSFELTQLPSNCITDQALEGNDAIIYLIATIQIYVAFATMLPLHHHHAIACPHPTTSDVMPFFSVPQKPNVAAGVPCSNAC
jgi:hypothetical protein